MGSTPTTDRGGRPPKRPTGRERRALVSAVLIGLAAWALAPAGIIELGKKGQRGKGSATHVYAGNCVYGVQHIPPSDPPLRILSEMEDCINGDPNAACTVSGPANCADAVTGPYQAQLILDGSDPNDSNRLVVETRTGNTPSRLRVREDDEDFTRAAVEHNELGQSLARAFIFPEVSAAAFDGTITVIATLTNSTTITADVDSTTVSDLSALNDAIETELRAEFPSPSFEVTRAGGHFTVETRGTPFREVDYSHTDTGIDVSDLELQSVSRGRVPALSTWGLAALAALLAASALLVLRRRRAANSY